MSSSTTVQWNSQLSLGNVAPEEWGLEEFVASSSDIAKQINSVLDIIQNLIETLSPFIVAPSDIIATLLREFSKPFLTMFQDALSFGGGFIVIHPYNRINKRYINVFSEKIPFYLPSMTPREAFSELYASFENKADPFRPHWGDNIKVAGAGVLITLPSVKGFVKLIKSFNKLINIKEFNDVLQKYQEDMGNIYTEATVAGLRSDNNPPEYLSEDQKIEWLQNKETRRKLQTEASLNLGDSINSDLTSLFTEWRESNISFNFGSRGGTGSYPTLTNSDTLPSLHWWSLSLNNFTFLKAMVDRLDKSIKTILNISEANNKLIDNVVKALLKKIKALREIIQEVNSLIEGFAISVASSGIYAFVLPPTPEGETGGVNYIIDSLKQSLSDPSGEDARKVATILDSSENTLLFFSAASTGINLTAWSQLFTNAFLNISQTSLPFIQLQQLQFTILPNLNNTVLPFNQSFVLRVVSSSSTNTNQLYYTYKIISSSGVEHSSYLSRNILSDAAKVNSTTFAINFPNPLNVPSTEYYTIEISVFDVLLNTSSITYNFQISNIATLSRVTVNEEESSLLTINKFTKDSALGKTSDGLSGGFVEIIDTSSSGKNVIRKDYFGSDTYLIGSLPPFVDPINIEVSTNSGNSVSFQVVNDTGYEVLSTSFPIKSKYSFASYPGKLYIDEPGALAYRVKGSEAWNYLSLPSSILFSEDIEIEYMIYPLNGVSGNNNWLGPYTIKTGLLEEGESSLC